MGFWSRVLGRTERRFGVPAEVAFNVVPSAMESVSASRAELLAGVAACTQLISGTVASLPVSIMTDDGAPAPPSVPAWKLLKRPHPLVSWPSLMLQMCSSILLHGNFVAQVQLDGRGVPSALVPAPWPWLAPVIVRTGEGAQLAFDVMQSNEVDLLGLPRRLLASECLFIRSKSDNGGLIGRSVIQRSPQVIREGIALQTMSESFFSAGMRPSAVLTAPQYLTTQQRERKDEFRQEFARAAKAGGVPILEGNWKLDVLSLTSSDAQMIENRAHNLNGVCSLFGVPIELIAPGPRAISDTSTFVTQLCQFAIVPLIRSIEAEFNDTLLADGLRLEFDADGLARGSFSSTVAALAALKQSAIVSSNDARLELGWPAVPGGDVLAPGNSPNYPADGNGLPAMHPSPGPADGTPQMPSHGNAGKSGNGKLPPMVRP